jgi:MerR family transcriptional regulator, mercuric resistance operon regulatory protein
MTEKITIGRLAAAANVNVETVRFYQRSGLIEEPARPYRGYRTYGKDDVRRIRFIKRAQLLGFTLDEITSLLKLEGLRTCSDTRNLAATKLAIVEAKLGDLLAMKVALATMIAQCDSQDSTRGCPIIQALVDDHAPWPT